MYVKAYKHTKVTLRVLMSVFDFLHEQQILLNSKLNSKYLLKGNHLHKNATRRKKFFIKVVEH